MKSAIITDQQPLAADMAPDTGLAAAASRLAAAMRSALAARQARTELAGLDAHLLRDIGVADDEIARVHAGEAFVPRNWRE